MAIPVAAAAAGPTSQTVLASAWTAAGTDSPGCVAATAAALAGPGCGADADGAKLYCARMAKTVADHAIQVLGGNGYVEAYEVERLWRDARLLEIGGGTNEMLQKAITRHLARRETLG